MNSRYNEWLNSLTDDERDEVVILDAYFATRSPLPDKSAAGNDYVAEHKSTQEISDDLFSMMPVSCRTISNGASGVICRCPDYYDFFLEQFFLHFFLS